MQSKKLDEMDLDDILTKADAFDTDATAQPGTTSLGGEGFLSQFAEIQDVKNDMADDLSWDDIIPVAERVKLDEEENKPDPAGSASSRKRAAARPPGTYEGMDFDDGEGTSSKPGSPMEKKGKGQGLPRKSNAEKAMDLKGELGETASLMAERDLRVLIRGMQKWGDVRTRYDPIVSSCCFSPFLADSCRSRKLVSRLRTASLSSKPAETSSAKPRSASLSTRLIFGACKIEASRSARRSAKRQSCSSTSRLGGSTRRPLSHDTTS